MSEQDVFSPRHEVQQSELFFSEHASQHIAAPERHPTVMRPGGRTSPLQRPTGLRPAGTPSPSQSPPKSHIQNCPVGLRPPSPSQSTSPESQAQTRPVTQKQHSSWQDKSYRTYTPISQSPPCTSPSTPAHYHVVPPAPHLQVSPPQERKEVQNPPPLPPKVHVSAQDTTQNSPREDGAEEPRNSISIPPIPSMNPLVAEIIHTPDDVQQEIQTDEPPPAYYESRRMSLPAEKETHGVHGLAGAAASAAYIGGAFAGVNTSEALASLPEPSESSDNAQTAKIPPPLPPRPSTSRKASDTGVGTATTSAAQVGGAVAGVDTGPGAKAKVEQPSRSESTTPPAESEHGASAAAVSAAQVGAAVAGVSAEEKTHGKHGRRELFCQSVTHAFEKAKAHHQAYHEARKSQSSNKVETRGVQAVTPVHLVK